MVTLERNCREIQYQHSLTSKWNKFKELLKMDSFPTPTTGPKNTINYFEECVSVYFFDFIGTVI